MELPGGALQAAVGVCVSRGIDRRAERQSGRTLSAPYSRYYSINAVGTAGSRDVKSAFFEISAPVLEQLELAASGRYDEYSTRPVELLAEGRLQVHAGRKIAIRGTWSKGFRIPSFNEAFGLPTTGYVARHGGLRDATRRSAPRTATMPMRRARTAWA